MDTLAKGYELLLVLLGNQYILATLTLCGMVLTVLGAFSVIDAIRMPRKLGRSGLPLAPLFDEVVIVGDHALQPLVDKPHPVSRLLSGALSGLIGAASFAAVIGIGYRHGSVGIITGAALGLGLGLAVALRPAMRWLARATHVTLDLVVVRAAINTVTYFMGLIPFYLLVFILFILAFLLITVVWIVLLPWLLFVWIVRRVRHRPSNTTAVLAPFAFVARVPAASAQARASRPWQDPSNTSFSARATRWALHWPSQAQEYIIALIVGIIYAAIGQQVVLALLQRSTDRTLLIGILVIVGFMVGRIFELAVESRYFSAIAKPSEFDEFVKNGPAMLDGLRVGLVTGLSLGTIVGIVPRSSVISQVVVGLLHGVAAQEWTGLVLAGTIALALSIVPDLMGRFAPAFVNWAIRSLRFVHVRTAMGIAGFVLLLAGLGLQVLQYVIPVH